MIHAFALRFIINATILRCQPKRVGILICFFIRMCDFSKFVALVFNIFIFLSIFRFQQNNLRLKIGMFHHIHISYREKNLMNICMMPGKGWRVVVVLSSML